MAQPVTAILSRQGELAARARKFTDDTNLAGLLVGRVVSRALVTRERGVFGGGGPAEAQRSRHEQP